MFVKMIIYCYYRYIIMSLNRKIFSFLIVIFSLPLLLSATLTIVRLLSQAAYQPANIIIDTKDDTGTWRNNWTNFSQGGEEPPPMLSPVIKQMNTLSPKYIRLDHIYDYYDIVKTTSTGIIFDFSRLDETVNHILAMRAKPFFSLSYMPKVFTTNNSVIEAPSDWNKWRDLVKETIEHYSGRQGLNLSDIYYEVWNEPELDQFGGWKLKEPKDYRLLYLYAAEGANLSRDVNRFYLGGPAVGSYYPNWIDEFADYIVKNKLRLDFYSWHRYHKNADIYHQDAIKIRSRLKKYPEFANIPLILTEWGIDSENNQNNNTDKTAAYIVSAIRQFTDDLDLAFNFEVKDGPAPQGGNWGLLTHEHAEKPLHPKPKYHAYMVMNNITGKKIKVNGEGTFIKALAAKNNKKIIAIISNYDWREKNIEKVPVVFTGLTPAIYNLRYQYVLSSDSGKSEIAVTDGKLSSSFIMLPNSILFLELETAGQFAQFIPGANGRPNDKALILQNSDVPLSFPSPIFDWNLENKISFDLKPLWEKDDNNTFIIFEMPYLSGNKVVKLYLSKLKSTEGNFLVLGTTVTQPETRLAIPIDNWKQEDWHHIEIVFNYNQINLQVDGYTQTQYVNLGMTEGIKLVSFYPVEAGLDNLYISSGNREITKRGFNGRLDE